MWFDVRKVETWVAPLEDRVGALAGKLGGLAKFDVNLDFIVSRRTPEQPGQGVVFLAPISTPALVAAAEKLGFHKSTTMHTLRLEGPDEPGKGFLIAQALASNGINLRGLSAARMGGSFIMYIAFDSAADAEKAIATLKRSI